MDSHLRYINRTALTVSVASVLQMQQQWQLRHDAFWAAAAETMVQDSAESRVTATTRRRRASSYPLTYVSCSSSQQSDLHNYHSEAMTWTELSANQSSGTQLVADWFGSVSESVYAAQITAGFETMLSKATTGTTYVCESSSCTNGCICGSGNVFAYVYPHNYWAAQIIYICSFTFSYEPASERVQTVVHELSHFDNAANTNDYAYGESSCKSLASSNPTAAVNNADSMGYFAKYVGTSSAVLAEPQAYVLGVVFLPLLSLWCNELPVP